MKVNLHAWAFTILKPIYPLKFFMMLKLRQSINYKERCIIKKGDIVFIKIVIVFRKRTANFGLGGSSRVCYHNTTTTIRL